MLSSTEDKTVLKLLEEACIELMKQSFVFKTQDGSQAKYRAVYCRMLWSKSHDHTTCHACSSVGSYMFCPQLFWQFTFTSLLLPFLPPSRCGVSHVTSVIHTNAMHGVNMSVLAVHLYFNLFSLPLQSLWPTSATPNEEPRQQSSLTTGRNT